MVCGQCGASNPEGMRFCGQCGAPLGRSCPACGAPAAESNRFCGQCGAALGSVRAAPVAERRVCSVLFVDLVGFTPLAEARDPEDVRELLSRYFERARTAVGRYGGTVEKFIGDAVMAVWGTPVAFEGDAERAVRAGLELVDLVAALGVEWGLPGLAARAGVVTGEVAVTLGASGEGMVAGDPVNTAARVQAAAPAGTVLVDEPTRRAAGPSVAFEDVGVHGLKGKADGQPLWRALRVVSWVGATRPADGLEAPLCGRDPELRGLKDLLHAGVDRRQARLVWVTGPAGVGKSRLAWELEKYVDGLAQAMLWHRGRCLSYGEGAAFGALGEMVRQRFGIADEDASDVAARKLAEGVTRFVADPAERSYVGVRLGRLLGVSAEDDGGGPLAREELFAGWRLLFERLAAVAPVVLVVDDAQHADPGLLDFLEHLVDWSRAAAILVVVLARTEGELDRARVGRNRSVVRLEPLDRAAMVALVSGLVPGLPAAAVDTVAERAHGLPLFAVETVRALLEAGVVVRGADRRYDVRGDLGSVAVPDSLHGLLAARLDGLPPGLRSLAADAAVMGG
ncbi:MAG TPA: adenylate/guanylate cyclase domain-containing protein, partial [Acidimicrobiales bacterium]|nr:adenylate/guanylate cyclase domain-containing protein [Acidimicrobiales bacterium]